MAFWTEGTAQPKRNYRFKVTITGLGDNAAIWFAKSFKPPSYEVSEATHDYLDNKFYFPGRLTWGDCSMTLVDPLSPNTTAITNQILIASGYNIKREGEVSPVTISREAAATALGGVTIDILDAKGAPVESWTLNNPFVKSVSFSDLSYDNDELRTIDISFRYDWAVCENQNETGDEAVQFEP